MSWGNLKFLSIFLRKEVFDFYVGFTHGLL